MCTLPLIDYVHVGDLTVEEAQTLIEKAVARRGLRTRGARYDLPGRSASQGVTVLGEVGRPGIYPAVEIASCTIDLGCGRILGIGRTQGKHHPAARSVRANYRYLPRNLADDLQDNVEILPGDTITVPRAPIIYVVGDVGHPAGCSWTNGTLTVLQALGAGGRDESHGQDGCSANHPQRSDGDDGDAGSTEKDAGGESSGI